MNRFDAQTRRQTTRWNALWVAGLITLSVGCAHSPHATPFPARIARPTSGEVVLADQSILIVDASGSTDRTKGFPQEKALVRSYVEGMPPGRYQSAMRVLGGREDAQLRLETFDRYELRNRAEKLRWTGRETPLAAFFDEYVEILAKEPGRSVFVVFTDGVPTRYGKFIGTEQTLKSAQRLAESRQQRICFHLIQLGQDPRGEALLSDIADLTECGSHRSIDDLDGTAALYAFQQSIYNGPPPPVVVKQRAITDLDGDGVDDRFDRCPKTPRGARVDDRGCWVIEDYVFDTNSAQIRPEHIEQLQAVLNLLRQNQSLRIRLDGHTDNTGTAEYNFDLAEQRAESVRAFLVKGGIQADRIKVRGFGPRRPIASNTTAEGRQKNRRVEISVLNW